MFEASMKKLAACFPRKKPDWLHCHDGLPCVSAIQRFWLQDTDAPGCVLDSKYRKPVGQKDQIYLDVLTVAVLLRFYGRSEREAGLILSGTSPFAYGLMKQSGFNEFVAYIKDAIKMAKENLLYQQPDFIYYNERSKIVH